MAEGQQQHRLSYNSPEAAAAGVGSDGFSAEQLKGEEKGKLATPIGSLLLLLGRAVVGRRRRYRLL